MPCTHGIAATSIRTGQAGSTLSDRISSLKNFWFSVQALEIHLGHRIILGLSRICTDLAQYVRCCDFEDGKGRGNIEVLLQDGFLHALSAIDHDRWLE